MAELYIDKKPDKYGWYRLSDCSPSIGALCELVVYTSCGCILVAHYEPHREDFAIQFYNDHSEKCCKVLYWHPGTPAGFPEGGLY